MDLKADITRHTTDIYIVKLALKFAGPIKNLTKYFNKW